MIKIILTIMEQENGAIRFKVLGHNIGTPTHKEVEFTKELMVRINKRTDTESFSKTQDKIPMTIITWKDEENEHPNRG